MYNVVFEKSNHYRFIHTFSSKAEYLNYQHPHQVIAEGIPFEAAEILCHKTPEIYLILDAIENSADKHDRLHEMVLRQNLTKAIVDITYGRLHGSTQEIQTRNVNIPLPPDKPRNNREELIYLVYASCNLNTGQVDIENLINQVNRFLITLQKRHPPAI